MKLRLSLLALFVSGNNTFAATNQYLNINGTNDWVLVADSASLSLSNQWTFEAWINPSQITTNGGDPLNTIFAKPRNASGDVAFNFGLYAGFPSMGLNNGSGGNYALYSFNTPISTGQWTHLAATYDGNRIISYVNGNAVATGITALIVGDSNEPLYIGKEPYYYGTPPYRPFFGFMDDLPPFTGPDLMRVLV